MNDHERGYNAYRNLQLGAAVLDSSIKGYQAGKYAALAYHGYKLGKKFVNSFSQKEKKKMAPITPPPSARKGRSRTPRGGSSSRSGGPSSRSRSLSAMSVGRTVGSRSRTPRRRSASVAWSRVTQFQDRQNGAPGVMKTVQTKSVKKDPVRSALYEKKGIAFIQESSQSVDALQTAVLGHNTMVGKTGIFVAIGAIVKALIVKNGVTIHRLDNVIGSTKFQVGDKFEFNYKFSQASPNATGMYGASVTLNLGDLGGTYQNLIDKIANEVVNTYKVTAGVKESNMKIQWSEARYVPVDGKKSIATQVSLLGCKIHFYLKSELKFQNQSRNSLTSDAEVVETCPIRGKAFDVKGNALRYKGLSIDQTLTVNSLICDREKGYVAVNGSNFALYEPIGRNNFLGVKATGKVYVEPGALQQSALVDTVTISFDYLLQMLINIETGSALQTQFQHKFSKGRFYIMEKVIQPLTNPDGTGVKLMFENQFYIAGYAEFRLNKTTQPFFQSLN